MTFREELEKILLKTTPCGCDESTIVCIDCQDLINEAVTSIINLVDKEVIQPDQESDHQMSHRQGKGLQRNKLKENK